MNTVLTLSFSKHSQYSGEQRHANVIKLQSENSSSRAMCQIWREHRRVTHSIWRHLEKLHGRVDSKTKVQQKKKKEKEFQKYFAWRRHDLGATHIVGKKWILLISPIFHNFFWSLLSRGIGSSCSGVSVQGCLTFKPPWKIGTISLARKGAEGKLFDGQKNKDNVSFWDKCWAGLLAAPL